MRRRGGRRVVHAVQRDGEVGQKEKPLEGGLVDAGDLLDGSRGRELEVGDVVADVARGATGVVHRQRGPREARSLGHWLSLLFRRGDTVLVLGKLFEPELRLLVHPRRCPQRVSPVVAPTNGEDLRKIVAHLVLLEAVLIRREYQGDHPVDLGLNPIGPAGLVLYVRRLLLAEFRIQVEDHLPAIGVGRTLDVLAGNRHEAALRGADLERLVSPRRAVEGGVLRLAAEHQITLRFSLRVKVTANVHCENVPVVMTRTYWRTVAVAEEDWIRSKPGAADTTVNAPSVRFAKDTLSAESWSWIVTEVPVKLNT